MAHNICKAVILFLAVVQCTQAWTLNGYKGSFDNSIKVNYSDATQLIDAGYVDVTGIVVIWCFGYSGSTTTQGTKEFVEVTLAKTNMSVLVTDWEEEAYPGGLPDYPGAAQNTQTVGQQLGQAIASLVASGVDPDKTIIVGLSLGGQLAGKAGATVQELIGRPLQLIVGLDAAKPLFEPEVIRCIKSTDAKTVLLLHTDIYRLGVLGSYGTHNFFANPAFYNSRGYQRGCSLVQTTLTPILLMQEFDYTSPVFCSHRHAVDYFIDALKTIQDPMNLFFNDITDCTIIGNRATSLAALLLRGQSPLDLTCLNYGVAQSPQGNYYFDTKTDPPYGLGVAGTRPSVF